jgi:hypothetical protein
MTSTTPQPAGTAYPPEPWYLGGTLLVSAFRLPVDDLPAVLTRALPPRRRLVRGVAHAVVGTAFARYAPGGALQYNELLVAAPTVGAGWPRFTIPQIWVDSPASLAGGRELWGIPKQLGEFTRRAAGREVEVEMAADGAPVAGLHARYGRPFVAGMHQVPLPILQRAGAGTILSHNRVIGTVTALRTTWSFDPRGPLAYLAGRSPFASFALRDASIVFGMRVER